MEIAMDYIKKEPGSSPNVYVNTYLRLKCGFNGRSKAKLL